MSRPSTPSSEFFSNFEGFLKKFKLTTENQKDQEVLTLANLDSGRIRKFIVKKVDERSLFGRRNSQKSLKDENENKSKKKKTLDSFRKKEKKNDGKRRLSTSSLHSLKASCNLKRFGSSKSLAGSKSLSNFTPEKKKKRRSSFGSGKFKLGWGSSSSESGADDDEDDDIFECNETEMTADDESRGENNKDPGFTNEVLVKEDFEDEGVEVGGKEEEVAKEVEPSMDSKKGREDSSESESLSSLDTSSPSSSPRFKLKMSPVPKRSRNKKSDPSHSPVSFRGGYQSNRSSISSVRKGILKKTNSCTTINMEMANLSRPQTPSGSVESFEEDYPNTETTRFTRTGDNPHLRHQRSFNRVKFILDSGRPDNITGDYDDIKIEKNDKSDRQDKSKMAAADPGEKGLTRSGRKCLVFSAGLLIMTMAVILGSFYGSRKRGLPKALAAEGGNFKKNIEFAVEGRFRILNENFYEYLYNPDSTQFQKMSDAIEDVMVKAIFLKETANEANSTIKLRVVKYEKGSVITIFRIKWEQTPSLKLPEIRKRVFKHLDKYGAFGDFKVDPASFSISELRDLCDGNPQSCSHICVLSDDTLRFGCTCPDNLILVNNTNCISPKLTTTTAKNPVYIPEIINEVLRISNANLLAVNQETVTKEEVPRTSQEKPPTEKEDEDKDADKQTPGKNETISGEETPPVEEETDAVKQDNAEETPLAEGETPAVKEDNVEETPPPEGEAPVKEDKAEETPVVEGETSTAEEDVEETPTLEEETPAVKDDAEETPAVEEETTVVREDDLKNGKPTDLAGEEKTPTEEKEEEKTVEESVPQAKDETGKLPEDGQLPEPTGLDKQPPEENTNSTSSVDEISDKSKPEVQTSSPKPTPSEDKDSDIEPVEKNATKIISEDEGILEINNTKVENETITKDNSSLSDVSGKETPVSKETTSEQEIEKAVLDTVSKTNETVLTEDEKKLQEERIADEKIAKTPIEQVTETPDVPSRSKEPSVKKSETPKNLSEDSLLSPANETSLPKEEIITSYAENVEDSGVEIIPLTPTSEITVVPFSEPRVIKEDTSKDSKEPTDGIEETKKGDGHSASINETSTLNQSQGHVLNETEKVNASLGNDSSDTAEIGRSPEVVNETYTSPDSRPVITYETGGGSSNTSDSEEPISVVTLVPDLSSTKVTKMNEVSRPKEGVESYSNHTTVSSSEVDNITTVNRTEGSITVVKATTLATTVASYVLGVNDTSTEATINVTSLVLNTTGASEDSAMNSTHDEPTEATKLHNTTETPRPTTTEVPKHVILAQPLLTTQATTTSSTTLKPITKASIKPNRTDYPKKEIVTVQGILLEEVTQQPSSHSTSQSPSTSSPTSTTTLSPAINSSLPQEKDDFKFDLGVISNVSHDLSIPGAQVDKPVDSPEPDVQDGSNNNASSTSTQSSLNVTTKLKPSCSEEEFQCGDGDCVKKSFRCDSVHDCMDQSDEEECIENNCLENYQCRWSGDCLERKFVCDGVKHCNDGDDEEGCETWKCNSEEFHCGFGSSTSCVPLSQKCDGHPDCSNRTDERNCTLSECPKDRFLCPEGNCIPNLWKCDGMSDCLNGEDEMDCGCEGLDQSPCAVGGCVPTFKLCDGLRQCSDGSDEWGCLKIDNKTKQLQVRSSGGRWSAVCGDKWTAQWTDLVCEQLGFGISLSTEVRRVPESALLPRMRLSPDAPEVSRRGRAPLQYFLTHGDCTNGPLVHVSCKMPECGQWNISKPEVMLHASPEDEQAWPSLGLLIQAESHETSAYKSTCAASIITPIWVLTSYSCLASKPNGFDAEKWVLLVGESSPKAGNDNTQLRYAKQIVVYPGAKRISNTWVGDAALLRIETPVTLSESIQPICFSNEPLESHDPCIIVSWKTLMADTNKGKEKTLHQSVQALPVPNLTVNTCNTSYYEGQLTKSHLCASFLQDKNTPCTGNEGTPLMCRKPGGSWQLHGLLSHAGNCANFNLPSVFTDITTLNSWVLNTIGRSVSTVEETITTTTTTTTTTTPATTSTVPTSGNSSQVFNSSSPISEGGVLNVTTSNTFALAKTNEQMEASRIESSSSQPEWQNIANGAS